MSFVSKQNPYYNKKIYDGKRAYLTRLADQVVIGTFTIVLITAAFSSSAN